MRHGDKIKNLSRTYQHRAALLANLTCQLIEHKRITTTLAKAKSLRVYVEPIITRSKEDNMHNRRIIFSRLQDKKAINELFGVIGDKVANRPGGYTRIIKLPHRMGDASDMALIELVDFNEIYGKEASTAAKKTRRSRRSGGGKKAAGTAPENATTVDAANTAVNSQITDSVTDTQSEGTENNTAEGTNE
jgi:large subunit ribosomal protein L17